MSGAMSGWLIFCNLRAFSEIIFPSCNGSERQVLREGPKKEMSEAR